MKILGIDPASKTGVAVLEFKKEVGTLLFCTCLDFSKMGKMKNHKQSPDRFFASVFSYDDVLEEILSEHIIDLVGIEHNKFLGRNNRFNSYVQYGVISIIQGINALNKLPQSLHVNPKEAKKVVIGDGNATKNDSINYARKYGYQGNDDNVADAIMIADYIYKTQKNKR